jgi:DNA polymerase-4
VDSLDTLRLVLLELSQELMQRLIREGLTSSTVVLKLRFHDFTTTTVRRTLSHRVASSEELLDTAAKLLDQRWDGSTPIRLIGIGVAEVVTPGREIQGELFDDPLQKQRRVEETVTALRESMSGLKITRASLLDAGRRPSGGQPRK